MRKEVNEGRRVIWAHGNKEVAGTWSCYQDMGKKLKKGTGRGVFRVQTEKKRRNFTLQEPDLLHYFHQESVTTHTILHIIMHPPVPGIILGLLDC
jgi:hypothetical protein